MEAPGNGLLTGIKIAKMANDHCCVPLCNDDKRNHSGTDLSYFNFPSDRQKTKAHTILHISTLFMPIQPRFKSKMAAA